MPSFFWGGKGCSQRHHSLGFLCGGKLGRFFDFSPEFNSVPSFLLDYIFQKDIRVELCVVYTRFICFNACVFHLHCGGTNPIGLFPAARGLS